MNQCNKIIKNLKENKDVEFSTAFRMADFARFVAHGFPDKWDVNKEIFKKMIHIQADLAADNSMLFERINSYLEENEILEGSRSTLYENLNMFSKSHEQKFMAKTTFLSKFTAQISNLRIWFDFEEISKNPDLIIAAQPTRGLDVGAIEYIHKRLVEERDNDKGVLLVSLELDEVLALSDRIAVMYDGMVVGILDRKDADEQKLGILMAGGTLDEGKGVKSNE